MSRTRREQDFRKLENRIAQLEHENQMLKKSVDQYHQAPVYPFNRDMIDTHDTSMVELQSRNQRLAREAEKYQQAIKQDLFEFIRQSSDGFKQCSFKQKYSNALRYPVTYQRIVWRR